MLAIAGSALVLVGAIAISIVVFAIALTAVLVFGVYVWWQARKLRKRMPPPGQQDGGVIEGQVIRKSTRDEPLKP